MMDKELLRLAFDESGSDKACDHSYHDAYAQILPDNLDSLLEIGIANFNSAESSLHAWTRVYPEAKIYGADIVHDKLINDGSIKSYHLDQSDPLSLFNFTQEIDETFDVIIDDGSHIFEHAALTYQFLERLVKPGGVYCIEDIQKDSHPMQQTLYDWENYLNANSIVYKVYETEPEKNADSIVIEIRKQDG